MTDIQFALSEQSQTVNAGLMTTMVIRAEDSPYILIEKSAHDTQAAFLHKIADGKLLLRYSSMTCNVTCDCCGSEEHIVYSPDFPDNLKHKDWCIVTAARSFFPGFQPSSYPDDHVHGFRRWGNTDGHNAQFSWLEKQP